jgi:type I restriction enzyme S subunit
VNFITKKMIENLEIPLPPLPEQQRIVSILDEAFAAIAKAKANAEQNLKNAKELFESYLQGVFEEKGDGWEEKTLKEISIEFARGKSKHRPRGDESLLGGDYPLIQTGDISNAEHWIYEFSQTYNEKGLAQSKLWPKGTICIAIVGANVGETAILNFDACFPDSVIGIVVNPKKANCEYVDYLLQTFKAYLKEKGKGTARDNINLGTFENQKFPFPSIEQQQTIVRQLDALRTETQKLEAVYQKKIDDLEELKKSILRKALSGELKSEIKETQMI